MVTEGNFGSNGETDGMVRSVAVAVLRCVTYGIKNSGEHVSPFTS